MAVWLSGSALVSINDVTLRRVRLLLGRVTAFGRDNLLGMQPTTQVNSAWPSMKLRKQRRVMAESNGSLLLGL